VPDSETKKRGQKGCFFIFQSSHKHSRDKQETVRIWRLILTLPSKHFNEAFKRNIYHLNKKPNSIHLRIKITYTMTYHISKIIGQQDFLSAKEKVTEALKSEGFGVLTEIDIQATMKKKLDKDYHPFLILGACNPGYADKVLTIDPHMSVMLPCNVILRQMENGKIEISAVEPVSAMGSIGNQEIESLAKEVQQKLKRVIDKVD
jgi:uncharacterized protein (DUF302 family)